MDDRPDDPGRRRFIIGAAVALPMLGGAGELLARFIRRHAAQEADKIPARPFIDPQHDRQLPIQHMAAEAASDRDERR